MPVRPSVWLAWTVAALLAAPARAQEMPPESTAPGLVLFREWAQAVAGHTPRVLDDALATAVRWNDADLWTIAMYVHVARLVALGEPFGRTVRVEVPGGFAARDLVVTATDREAIRTVAPSGDAFSAWLQRAALFHTDVALLGAAAPVPVAAAPRGASQLRLELGDGQGVSVDRISAHWAMGRWLAARVTDGDGSWEGRWYAATAGAQQARAQFGGGHLAEAVRRRPESARLWFLRGCEHEAFASPLLQQARQSASPPRGMRFEMEAAAREREDAVRAFRRALALAPGDAEIQLRLGRVLMAQGKAAEAATLLRRVVDAGLEPALTYLRQLFLGDAEDALGRTDAARAAYEAALALYPGAQSARLALAQAARVAGDVRAAQDAVSTDLAEPAERRATTDPWWDYLVIQARGWETELSDLWRQLEPRP